MPDVSLDARSEMRAPPLSLSQCCFAHPQLWEALLDSTVGVSLDEMEHRSSGRTEISPETEIVLGAHTH